MFILEEYIAMVKVYFIHSCNFSLKELDM